MDYNRWLIIRINYSIYTTSIKIVLPHICVLGIECHGKVLATNVGHIQCLKFSSDSQFIAFGHWNEALIYRTKVCNLHQGVVLSSATY